MEAITVLNLDKKSAQEVFDFVVNHLLTQNQKAINETTRDCAYREGDLKCAAGCLIPDDLYTPEIEGSSWKVTIITCGWSAAHYGLIYSLQSIHDIYDPIYWKDRLKELALSRGLQFNESMPK